MGISIRKFLLISLLVVITLTSSLAVFSTYYLDHYYIYEQPIEQKTNFIERLFESELVNKVLVVLLLVSPLAVILIWFIVWRALHSIMQTTEAIKKRAPNYLEPVDVYLAPVEIRPLIIELNKLFLKLQEALEREQRFAADAAHELRTPLAAIRTQAQVALHAAENGEQKLLLNNVISGVDRSSHVVQQLLTLGRLPEHSANAQQDNIRLAHLAQDVIDLLTPMAEQKKLHIKLQCTDPTLQITGNATAIGILVRNLLDNAIRYTYEGGFIRVAITERDQQPTLQVIDNGPGIPVELRARVFERFYRVLGTTATGSGLGLAIVQQIAKLHGAEINLGSAEDNATGLKVEIIFPKQIHTS